MQISPGTHFSRPGWRSPRPRVPASPRLGAEGGAGRTSLAAPLPQRSDRPGDVVLRLVLAVVGDRRVGRRDGSQLLGMARRVARSVGHVDQVLLLLVRPDPE